MTDTDELKRPLILGVTDVAVAYLTLSWCSACGSRATHVEFQSKVVASVSMQSGNGATLEGHSATPWRDPVARALDTAADEGEDWTFELTARCMCGNEWETTVKAVMKKSK